MQIYSSQKSQKSNNEEPAVIDLDEDDIDYSPSKQFLRKNLEESSFLPDQVIPAKIEKKKSIIKRVRFHDDEPEQQSFDDEDEEIETSSYEVRVAKKRQVTRSTAEIEELEINQDTEQDYKLRSKKLRTNSQDISIEEHVELPKKNIRPKLFTEECSSQETIKKRSLKQIKKKKAITSPAIEVIGTGNSTSAQTTPAAKKKDKMVLDKKMQDHFEKVVAPDVKQNSQLMKMMKMIAMKK